MITVVSGILVGALFGFSLQRGRFCMNSAFRDIIVGRDFNLVKAVGVALLVETLGFSIMAMTGVIKMAPPALMWGAEGVGGLLFGMGMVLAGGCASGITYRAGEGLVGAFSAIVGFSLFALTTSAGVLSPVANFLKTNTKISAADGSPLTLGNIFGINANVVGLVLSVVIIAVWVVLALRKRTEEEPGEKPKSIWEAIFKKGWSWPAAGIAVGLVGVLAFPLSAATGRNYPLGITAGWNNIWQTLFVPGTVMNWGGALIIGIVLGSLVGAAIAGELALRAPAPKVLVQAFIGGSLMGFGATVAGGCNVGHVLSGVPQLSIGSMFDTFMIIAGCWIMAYFLFIRPMNAAR